MARVIRKTIARDTVFRSTNPAVSALETKREDESFNRQTAVWLTDDEIDWLDDTRRQTRKNGGKAITRSALIRALVEVSMERTFDLKGLTSNGELIPRLRSAFSA